MKIKEILKDYYNKIVDDDYRYRVQLVVIPLVLAIVAGIMTIMNIFTNKTGLMIATLCFTVISLLITILAYLSEKTIRLCKTLFVLEIIALFTYFLITGGTKGFSPYWICLFPCFAMLALNKKSGSAWCGVMFVIIVFFLWTPWGNNLMKWEGDFLTQEFRMRFPVVFAAYFLVGLFLEHVRDITNKKLRAISESYKDQSMKDQLTCLNNQVWLSNYESDLKDRLESLENLVVVFIDVDNFKSFNEDYGHLFGNKVLKAIADELSKTDKAISVRWGGDEFVLLFENVFKKEVFALCDELRQRVENLRFDDYPSARVTISSGIYLKTVDEKFNFMEVVRKADESIAVAKHEGKNRVYMLTDVE